MSLFHLVFSLTFVGEALGILAKIIRDITYDLSSQDLVSSSGLY
jgi:hypothetical protein